MLAINHVRALVVDDLTWIEYGTAWLHSAGAGCLQCGKNSQLGAEMKKTMLFSSMTGGKAKLPNYQMNNEKNAKIGTIMWHFIRAVGSTCPLIVVRTSK